MRARNARTILLGQSLLLAAAIAAPSVTLLAVANVLYVDGKNGSDSNSGADLAHAYRTIAAAASDLPAGSSAAGWTVRVVGYTDYVYRERPIPPSWNRSGTAASPVAFEAVGYNGSSTGYTMPIVSGADPAPAPGSSWSAVSTGVWKTPWATAPFNFGTTSGSLKTAVFQDVTGWLWEQTSLATLQSAASNGKGGYWWSGGWLYVAPRNHVAPAGHTFDVIVRNAFYFSGTSGVDNVTVRGFEVRHSANGIAFVKGVDGGRAIDDRVIGNLMMGIAVSGGMNGSTPDPAQDAVIQRVEGAWNTLQAVKIDEGAVDAVVCDGDFHHNGLQGIKIQGPPGGTSYTGTTTGTLVCRNDLHEQDYNPTGTAFNNAAGVTISNGAKTTTVSENLIWGNDVGVHLSQESTGMPAMTGTTLDHNRIWSNRRFGLNLFDGYNGSGSGSLTSSYDLYWLNGIGVMADRGTTNKVLDHVTIWKSTTEGLKVGSTTNPASISVTNSLITGNGGWGLWLVTGNTASLSHVGLNGNAGGNIKGSPTQTAVNTQPPGYLTTNAAQAGFLTIAPGSYQFTAGSGGTPIGALWWVGGFIDVAGASYEADVDWLVAEGITNGCSTYYFCPEDSMTRGQMAAFLKRALLLPATGSDFFADDNGTTFEADINRLAAADIAKGCAPLAYCPTNFVTRGQLAAFLVRALELPQATSDYYSDDNGTTFEGDINALAEAGIATSCSPTGFCPNTNATRATMAIFLHRALG